MGGCSSTGQSESDLLAAQEVQRKSVVSTEAENSAMGERSDLNRFMEVSNAMTKIVKEKFESCDELWRSHRQMKKENERLTAENERLRQMLSNDSEMNHRSHQSSSEDARSRNKQSDVIHKYKAMDGATRKNAIEAFGKQTAVKPELWYRKDLTCRIFQTAYGVAERVRNYFNQQALPRIFQCAPSVAVLFNENFPQGATKLSQQHVSEDIRNLLSAESFKVASSSLLKELADSCDLTDLEEKIVVELANCREHWRDRCPWLPYLDDSLMENGKAIHIYIKECVKVAWRMVNLLPPLKIVTVDSLQGTQFDNFFDTEIDENKEKAQTMKICVWPAVTHADNPKDVICKGTVVIIPRPKNYPHTA